MAHIELILNWSPRLIQFVELSAVSIRRFLTDKATSQTCRENLPNMCFILKIASSQMSHLLPDVCKSHDQASNGISGMAFGG